MFDLEDVIESGMYRYGSKEEIVMAMMDCSFLYTTTMGLFPWISECIKKC
ncbi:hypothetical protein [Anaerovorax odorimutans]|nr:hypothetical protein [Anaerovorax odorimutans]